jgi:hypothetical protein
MPGSIVPIGSGQVMGPAGEVVGRETDGLLDPELPPGIVGIPGMVPVPLPVPEDDPLGAVMPGMVAALPSPPVEAIDPDGDEDGSIPGMAEDVLEPSMAGIDPEEVAGAGAMPPIAADEVGLPFMAGIDWWDDPPALSAALFAALTDGEPTSATVPTRAAAATGIDVHNILLRERIPAGWRSGMTSMSAPTSSTPVIDKPTRSAVSQPFTR